ncbi:hypothetical protein [Kribbella lupini]|uniref:Uncharacterized protein n=1 Tax=Kribbella lupini TaxID=291602 RepID=A0ABN2AMP1_9ACTN
METVANSVQLPPLDNPNERAAVGAELQAALHDLIDLVTQEVLIRVVGTLEKQQWLLRVQVGEKA